MQSQLRGPPLHQGHSLRTASAPRWVPGTYAGRGSPADAHPRYIRAGSAAEASMDRKTETLNLRVSAELKELVRAAAAKDHRTIANFIEVLVREHCERAGIEASRDNGRRPSPR